MNQIKKLARVSAKGRVFYVLVSERQATEIFGDIYENFRLTKKIWPLGKLKILAPTEPSKVVAVGLNYIDHARELKMPLPAEPLIFLKAPTAVIGPGSKIVYPDISRSVHYEAELAIIIKKKARNILPAKVPDYILGYTCANDVTARDLQAKDGQWARAKSFDTFCPCGPYIVQGVNPAHLKIQLLVNGEIKQNSTTRQMIFKIPQLVSFISRVMTLFPGDLILTGTPAGVGPVKKGDLVEVMIEKIGSLKNKVK